VKFVRQHIGSVDLIKFTVIVGGNEARKGFRGGGGGGGMALGDLELGGRAGERQCQDANGSARQYNEAIGVRRGHEEWGCPVRRHGIWRCISW
jgi:hypothetical protein